MWGGEWRQQHRGLSDAHHGCDPVELDLYFERFITQYRANPPDRISILDRPGDIIRFIFDRFPHVSLLRPQVTFQYRAVVRNRERSLAFQTGDRSLAGGMWMSLGLTRPLNWSFATENEYGMVPNYLSIHAGGIPSQTVRFIASRPHFSHPRIPTAQFDMVVAEDVSTTSLIY